jgi:ribosomal protein S19E (S16A)
MYSEDYYVIKKKIEEWPKYKKCTYNCNFATSKHSNKINPETNEWYYVKCACESPIQPCEACDCSK